MEIGKWQVETRLGIREREREREKCKNYRLSIRKKDETTICNFSKCWNKNWELRTTWSLKSTKKMWLIVPKWKEKERNMRPFEKIWNKELNFGNEKKRIKRKMKSFINKSMENEESDEVQNKKKLIRNGMKRQIEIKFRQKDCIETSWNFKTELKLFMKKKKMIKTARNWLIKMVSNVKIRRNETIRNKNRTIIWKESMKEIDFESVEMRYGNMKDNDELKCREIQN